MSKNTPAPKGSIEPHKPLLNVPDDTQLLYKIMSVRNFLRSIIDNYLHFNRVDNYTDFPGADPCDGQQLSKDQHSSENANFVNNPDFSLADYYKQSRSRTYACCFSLENSDFIWSNYANDDAKGKVCVVFEFGKLRKMINETIQHAIDNNGLVYNSMRCFQIFSVNYGNIKYIDRKNHQASNEGSFNPIIYTYLKNK